jgi:hypothetical protein
VLIFNSHLPSGAHKNRQRKTDIELALFRAVRKGAELAPFLGRLEIVKIRQIGRLTGAAVLLKAVGCLGE